MANINKVKGRINATKKTSQITNAMNMISASKLKNAEAAIKDYRPFITKTFEIVSHIASSSSQLTHPLMQKREIKSICYIAISSDRGLAGAFNTNIAKELTKEIESNNGINYYVLPLGLKAYSFAKKMKYPLLSDEVFNLKDDVEFSIVEKIIRIIIKNYLLGIIDKVVVIYNHFKNSLVQEVTKTNVLPIECQTNLHLATYEFDGDIDEILNTALPIYIENTIYSFILDSKASEHASRMNSMKNATDNAEEVIESLELLYNRVRQSAITLEITDIVGGASVVNNN